MFVSSVCGCEKPTDIVPVTCNFHVVVNNYRELVVDTAVVSNNLFHNGDCWQLTVTKKPSEKNVSGGNCHCQMRLITMSKVCKESRLVAIQCPERNFTKCHVFNQSGDTQVFQCGYGDGARVNPFKIVISLLKGMEIVSFPKAPTTKTTIEPPKSELATEVLKWFKTEEFGDTTVVAADGIQFRCHRDILSARSEVFKLMFNAPMKESEENLITIEAYSGEIVALLLSFIYTDECGSIWSNGDRLYVAAHHYQLKRLKDLCEFAMADNLSAKTIVKTYRMAKFYGLDRLSAICVDHLNSHRSELPMEELLAGALEIQ